MVAALKSFKQTKISLKIFYGLNQKHFCFKFELFASIKMIYRILDNLLIIVINLEYDKWLKVNVCILSSNEFSYLSISIKMRHFFANYIYFPKHV